MLRAGQKVVCVDADGTNELREGAVYTITHLAPARKILWRGRWHHMSSVYLYEAKTNPGYEGFAPQRFRPAVDRPTDISVFKAVLRDRSRELVG